MYWLNKNIIQIKQTVKTLSDILIAASQKLKVKEEKKISKKFNQKRHNS